MEGEDFCGGDWGRVRAWLSKVAVVFRVVRMGNG